MRLAAPLAFAVIALPAGRSFETDRILINPEVPAIARLLVKTPDQRLWFYHPAPPAFLRMEGPPAEPGDQPIRIDVLPGTCKSETAAASPARKAEAR